MNREYVGCRVCADDTQLNDDTRLGNFRNDPTGTRFKKSICGPSLVMKVVSMFMIYVRLY